MMRAGALAAVAVVVAAALALLAGAAFGVERSLDSSGDPSLRVRVAESLLGAGDDRSLRQALRLIEEAEQPDALTATVLARHGEALARLSDLAGEGDAAQRSYVSTLIGFLYARDAELDQASGRRYLELAVEAFQVAVLLDPANADAKYDLELALDGLGEVVRGGRGSQGGGAGGAGAGSKPTGSGY